MSCGHFPTRRWKERGDVQNAQSAMRAGKGDQIAGNLNHASEPWADTKEKQDVEKTFTSAWSWTRPGHFPFSAAAWNTVACFRLHVKSAFTA